MGGGKTVTYKGHTVIHDDPAIKHWMYELLAAGMVHATSKDPDNAFTAGINPGMFIRFRTRLKGSCWSLRRRCRYRLMATRWPRERPGPTREFIARDASQAGAV